MTFLNETQRFQLGTLLKGAAIVHGFEDVPEWWGQTNATAADPVKNFEKSYGEFNLTALFQLGLGQNITPQEKQDCLFRSMWLQKAASELQQNLMDAKVRFTFVKGIAQDALYWHQNPLRIYADIDLWVHPKDMRACHSIFEALGYDYHPEPGSSLARSILPHAYTRTFEGKITSLDVHTFPFDAFRATHKWDNIWPRVRTVETALGKRNLLPPEDEIIFWAGNQLKSLFGTWPKACLDVYVLLQKEKLNESVILNQAKKAQLFWPTWALLNALRAVGVSAAHSNLEFIKPSRRQAALLKELMGNPIHTDPTYMEKLKRYVWVLALTGDVKTAINILTRWFPLRLQNKIFRTA